MGSMLQTPEAVIWREKKHEGADYHVIYQQYEQELRKKADVMKNE